MLVSHTGSIPGIGGSGGIQVPTSEPAQPGWRDEAWTSVVGSVDAMLRRGHGIYEFSDDAECVLRVGFRRARSAVRLTNGTVAAGAPIGELHLWNEHLPPFPPHGPDIRWAKVMDRKLRRSLAALAQHVEHNPGWAEVGALRASMALSGRLRAMQLLRLAKRYGFEMTTPDVSALGELHAFGEDFLLWAFARAFNPPALQRHHFLRDRVELWILRQTLTDRFLHEDPDRAPCMVAAEDS